MRLVSCIKCTREFSSLQGHSSSFDYHLWRFHSGELPAVEIPPPRAPDRPILYWIRAMGETDPYTQGYIGVTIRPLRDRIKLHKRTMSPAGKVLKEGGYLSVLHEVETEEELSTLESHYRPHTDIGLNKMRGMYFRKSPSAVAAADAPLVHSDKQ